MSRPLRALTTLALVMAASGLSGCSSWGCNTASVYDFAGDARGETTPRQAMSTWLWGDHGRAPDDGWRRSATRRGTTLFVNGHWSAGVVEAPAGGYLVGNAGCSMSR